MNHLRLKRDAVMVALRCSFPVYLHIVSLSIYSEFVFLFEKRFSKVQVFLIRRLNLI